MIDQIIRLIGDHLLLNLETILQNSSKLTHSLVAVFWFTWVLCIISKRSSSLMPSLSHLEMALNSSNSMTPSSLLSQMAKTFLHPSLVLISPTLEQTISRYSSKLTALCLSLRAQMRFRMKGFLPSVPRASRALVISSGSMVPLLSSSKTWKVSLRSLQSSAEILSFQAEGLEGAGADCLA